MRRHSSNNGQATDQVDRGGWGWERQSVIAQGMAEAAGILPPRCPIGSMGAAQAEIGLRFGGEHMHVI